MKIKIMYLSFVLLSIIFVSCNSKSQTPVDKESSFARLLPKCEMNSSIRFVPIKETFKFNEDIDLDVRNYSEKTILFPLGFNLRIYRYDTANTGQWLTIKDNTTYEGGPDQKIVFGPLSAGLESIDGVSIHPVLYGSSPLTIRVVITSDTDKSCFGAFVDIVVAP
jgi:hypothetical protein